MQYLVQWNRNQQLPKKKKKGTYREKFQGRDPRVERRWRGVKSAEVSNSVDLPLKNA